MNIYVQELKMKIHSVVTWSLSVSLLIFLFMAIFSSLAIEVALWDRMMNAFPEELLMAFGLTNTNMATVLGFYGFAFTFCQICIAIQGANYGFSLVSIEEREMTADFLLAKPVGRPQILTHKLLAALTSLIITALVLSLASYAAISAYRDGRPYDTKAFVLLLLSIVLLQIVFLALGMFISLLVRKVRNVTPYSMGLAFGMYVLNAFGGMLGDVKLEMITPFKHFDPNYIISHSAYDLPRVMISLAFVVISVAGSYLLYARRDIHSAV